MPWIQVSVTTGHNNYQRVEDALLLLGAQSVTFRDAADNPILEPQPGETPLWQDAVVTGLFDADFDVATLRARLTRELEDERLQIDITSLPDQDWTRAWMDDYQPMQFGKRLWVCPRHIEPPDPQAVNLRLDPGLAFGTGTHPTTSLCLGWLDAHVSERPPYREVLDYGCGSGILAIAALLLGAGRADCVDIDEQALQATRDNARANGVLGRIRAYTPQALPRDQRYQLVMANILSGPLTELAPTLVQHCDHGGDIVLSGILLEQADSVRKVYGELVDMHTIETREDWVLLHGSRR